MWARSFSSVPLLQSTWRRRTTTWMVSSSSSSYCSCSMIRLSGITDGGRQTTRKNHHPSRRRRRRLFPTRRQWLGGTTTHGDTDPTTTIVTYITDIEGDKAYLDRYVQRSKVLTFISTPPPTATTDTTATTVITTDEEEEEEEETPKQLLFFPYAQCIEFTDPRAMLVFGGDIWDKGGYDLYTIRQLLHLQQRYPHRVIFLLGNRDVNKLRILQELGIHEAVTPHHPGLRWFQGTGKVGDPSSPATLPPKNSAKRLQWMLANTMGSPDAFEHRRRELQWERRRSGAVVDADDATGADDSNDSNSKNKNNTVTDQEVVDSYRRSCHPQGELGRFLSHGLLICRLGPLLFVHGSLPLLSEHVVETEGLPNKDNNDKTSSVWDDFTFCMPWLPPGETARDHGVTTMEDWMIALNRFGHDKVEEWKKDIRRIEAMGGVDDADEPMWAQEAGYGYGPSYSDLIQYGMGMLPNRQKNPTVIYNTFTPSGMPERFFQDSDEPHMVQATKTFMERASVQVILAGHKPQGDMPSPIRVDDSAWVVLADTSYSGETIWHHHDDDDDDDENESESEMVGRSSSSSSSSSRRRTNLGRGDSLSFRGEVAVSEILIHLKGETLESLTYHGVLSDGSEYETVNLMTHGKNTTIGQAAPEHLVPSQSDSPHQGRWWTKSILNDGSHLFHAGEGFRIWNFVSSHTTATPSPQSKSPPYSATKDNEESR